MDDWPTAVGKMSTGLLADADELHKTFATLYDACAALDARSESVGQMESAMDAIEVAAKALFVNASALDADVQSVHNVVAGGGTSHDGFHGGKEWRSQSQVARGILEAQYKALQTLKMV